MFIAGDIGGTKSNLGAFEIRDGKIVRLFEHRFPSQSFSRAEDMIEEFAQEVKTRVGVKITAASFGIAGPVVKNRVHTTNLPWIIDGAALAKLLGLSQVRLLNDLESTAYGITVLESSEFEALQTGVPNLHATQAVLAAGTGLGEAILAWDGSRRLAIATEGGHADWAPRNDREVEFWRYLKARNEYISNELILAGRGFRSLHDFLGPQVHHPIFDDPAADPAPVITHQALEGSCQICSDALDFWIDIYGAEAGNLALRTAASGGVYVAGGIAVKILPRLQDGKFVQAFIAKEKFSEFLSRVPINVVLNENAPLLGAAFIASLTQK
jgi:glucokinase